MYAKVIKSAIRRKQQLCNKETSKSLNLWEWNALRISRWIHWGQWKPYNMFLWKSYVNPVGFLWKSTGILWKSIRIPIAFLWKSNGNLYGHPTDFRRKSYGTPIDFLWKSYGIPMEILWASHRFPMEILWTSHKFPKEILWKSYGNPIDFLWKFFGNPMDFLWKSYGHPIDFLWKFPWKSYGNPIGTVEDTHFLWKSLNLWGWNALRISLWIHWGQWTPYNIQSCWVHEEPTYNVLI